MKSSTTRRRYGSAYLGNAILLVANLLVLHLFARFFGSDGFAICSVARRNIGIISLFILPSLSITLTRLTAQYCESKPESSVLLLGIAQGILLGFLGPILLVCHLFPREFIRLSFGSVNNYDLAMPIAINILGLTILGLSCAALNGRLRIALSTTLSVIGLAFIPLLAFAADPASPVDYFWLLAQLLSIYSLTVSLLVFRVLWSSQVCFAGVGLLVKEFVAFALPRLPNSVGTNLLMTLPLILFSLETDDTGALAVIALSNYPITMSGLLVSPVATILLPETTQLIQKGGIRTLEKQVQKGILLTVAILTLIIPVASFAVKPALVYFIDPKLAENSHLLIWFVVATLPICLYRIFSSVLDALSPKAYNTQNTLSSILALIIAYLLLEKYDGTLAVVSSFLIGSCVLGGLTILRLKLLLKEIRNNSDLAA